MAESHFHPIVTTATAAKIAPTIDLSERVARRIPLAPLVTTEGISYGRGPMGSEAVQLFTDTDGSSRYVRVVEVIQGGPRESDYFEKKNIVHYFKHEQLLFVQNLR